MMMTIFDALNVARGSLPPEEQRLSEEICQLRGQSAWEPVFVQAIGTTIPRWQAVAAELALIEGAKR